MRMVEKKEVGDIDIKEINCIAHQEKSSKTNSKRSTMDTDHSSPSICNLGQEELLKSAKAKMGEVREENERLKKLLAKIVVDYKSLEKQISLMDQTIIENETSNNMKDEDDDDGQDRELVSLTLGSWTSSKKYDDDDDNSDTKKHVIDDSNKRRKIDARLQLGLSSMRNSSLDYKEEKEENTETSKEKSNSREGDEENLHQLPVKKTRVCIRSRCDTPTMNDGCQWRKYGQKIAKGNPCPRAYYRCTVSPTCPVRKQVQRCADDMSILITTYEGTHNHPLPMSATAMASATTAAASMLKTGSLTSQSTSLVVPTTSSSLSLHNTSSSTLLNPFINTMTNTLNPSMISSSSHSHPTITLDLTTPNTTSSPFHNWLASSSSLSSSRNNININPNSNFLNFSPSSSSSLDFTSRALPNISSNNTSWANNYFNYGTLFPNNSNNNHIMNNRNLLYQNPNNNNSQQSLNETIAAVATKAIASNPNFQSVLAAAISSYVGNTSTTSNNNNNNNNKDSNEKKSLSSSPPRNVQGGSSLLLFPASLSSKNNASSGNSSRDHVSL